MTDTPTKQENQSKTENVTSSSPNDQRRGNRNNERKRSRRGDSKNERDSEWQERVVQIRRVSKTVKGGKKMSFRAIVVVGNEKGQVGVGVGKAGDIIKERLENRYEWKNYLGWLLTHKELQMQAKKDYYKDKLILNLILKFYFLPYNTIRYFSYLCDRHKFEMIENEIKMLKKVQGDEDEQS